MKIAIIICLIFLNGCTSKQGLIVNQKLDPDIVESMNPLEIYEISVSEIKMRKDVFSSVDDLLGKLNTLRNEIESIKLNFKDKSNYDFHELQNKLKNWCVKSNVNYFVRPPMGKKGFVYQFVEKSI